MCSQCALTFYNNNHHCVPCPAIDLSVSAQPDDVRLLAKLTFFSSLSWSFLVWPRRSIDRRTLCACHLCLHAAELSSLGRPCNLVRRARHISKYEKKNMYIYEKIYFKIQFGCFSFCVLGASIALLSSQRELMFGDVLSFIGTLAGDKRRQEKETRN